LVLLVTLPGLLTRASLLSCFPSSPNLLGRASFDHAGSAHPYEFTFMIRKYAEPARSCFLQLCRVCSPVRVYFHVSQVLRTSSVVLLATLPGLLTRASLLSCFASSPSLLARASCDLAGSAHPCEFTFMFPKFSEPPRSCFLRPCRVCSTVPVYFHASQVRRVCSFVLLSTLPDHRDCSLVLLATLPVLLTRASLLSCIESSPSLLARASCDIAGSAHLYEFTFMLRKFAESARSCFFRPCRVYSPFAKPAGSCFLRPCRVCSPVRIYFHDSQVRGACSLVLLATLPGLLTRASLLSRFASSPILLTRASGDLVGSAPPCEFTFMFRKFAKPAGSCFLRPCRVCSPVRIYFHDSQVRGACSLVLLATLPGLLTRASLLSRFASSPILLTRASGDLVGSAPPCEFTFMFRKFAKPAGSCFLRPCRVCSPVRIYFHDSQVRGACSLVLLATLPGLLTRASLLSRFASSPILLTRASGDLVGSAPPCEFTFMFRKFAKPAGSCFLRPCRVCSPVRIYFHDSQVRGACSLVLLATLPGLLTRASLLSRFASSPILLTRASGDLVGSAPPCEFTFMFRKFAKPAGSCFLRPCRVCSPVRIYFHDSQVRGACSLVLLATLPGLLTRASLLSRFASSPILLTRASGDLVGSAPPCEFTFMFRKFAKPAGSCFLRPCRVCSPVRIYFHDSQVRGACSLVLLATLPGLLTRASLLSRFASSPILLTRASGDLVGSAPPCEFTFMFRKFAKPAGSCFLRPCRVCSPVRIYFHDSQVRGACSLVLLATLPGLLTRASLLLCFASFCLLVLLATLPGLLTRASLLSCFPSSPSLLGRASCDLARYAHPCAFTFMLRKFAKPTGWCFLLPCRVCSPYEFTFMLRRFAESSPSCFFRPCLVCSPVRVYFHATLVCRACWLVLLVTLPGLLARASLLLDFASFPSLLARASCDLPGSAPLCEFTFTLRKYAEPSHWCFLQPYRVCSPVRVYFHALQVRRACWLVPLATLPGLLTRASLLSCLESSLSLLARAFSQLAVSAYSCVFTFMLRKFTEPARSCFLRPSRVCSPVRVYFYASQVSACLCFLRPCRVCSPVRIYFHASHIRRAYWLVLHASLLARTSCYLTGSAHPTRSLLARASYNLAGSAHPCEFTFMLRKFAEPARSSFLRPCPICTPVRVYFHASHIRRAYWLVLHASLLARTSCYLTGSAHPYEFTFMLRKIVEPARSCFLRPCLICTPFAEPARSCFLLPFRFCSAVRVYFQASKVRRACSLVHLATLPGLLTRASLLSCFASSPRLLARASCDLAESVHPYEFTFILGNLAEPASSCLLRPCWVCSPVLVYFHASQDRRACSLVLLATLPNMHTRTSLLSCFASSPRLLARASCDLAESVHPCEFTFILGNLAEPASSCLLRPCWVCSPVLVYFHASQVRRACSLVLLATMPDLLIRAIRRAYLLVLLATSPNLLTRASLLSCFTSSPSLLPRPSCNIVALTRPCKFTFMLRKLVEPARSCHLQPCRVCSPVLVYFHALQVRRACSLVLLATLPGLLARASLLSCFASSPSLLARATCNLAGSSHLFEFTLMLRKFTEATRSCFLRPCRVCSPVRVYFHASQVHRGCSLVLLATLPSLFTLSRACWLDPLATLPGLLTRESFLSCFASSPSLLARAFATLPGLLTRASFLSCFASSPSLLARAFATLPGLLTRASFLSCFASSPSLLARSTCNPVGSLNLLGRATCNLAGSSHLCEFTFMLRKFVEPARSCHLQPFRVCAPVRVYFHVLQVPRACSVVQLATLPGLLTGVSLLSCFASSSSLLARASCNLAESDPPCEFTFMLRKFVEPARSCHLQPCRVCSPVQVFFHASQVSRACWLVLLATLPSLLTRASLLSFFASSLTLLARASCNLAESAHPCEFTFMLRKFVEPARSCHLQPCRVCTPVLVYFHASHVRRACSLVLLATLPGLLARASLLSCFASSPSLLARASCDLGGSAHPCEFTFFLRKFVDPVGLCFFRPCRVCSPLLVFFHASQVLRASLLVLLATLPGLLTFRRTCSLVLLATLSGLLARASLLSCFAISPRLLALVSCHLAGPTRLCEFTFMVRKFAEPARSCYLQPCRVFSPVRVYFHASQVHRGCSLVLLATFSGLLTRASLLSCFTSSLRLLARASFYLAGSVHPCEFTFIVRNLAEPAVLCLLRPSCQVSSPVRVYFDASEVRRACWLELLATQPGLLPRTSLLSCFASSLSLLPRASCNLAPSADPCVFTFMLGKLDGPARSFFLQPCRVCSPVRVYIHSSLVRRVCSIVLLATMPGLLTSASLLSCFASSSSLLARASCDLVGSPSLLARATCNLAESAPPCEFTFMLRKFAKPAPSCFLQPRRICSPVRVYFSDSEVRLACSLVLLATLPSLLLRASLHSCFASSLSLLPRASCNLAESAHPSPSLLARATCNLAESAPPCEFTFMLRKFAKPAPSCFLQPRRICSPVRVYFSDSEVRLACSLVLLATLPSLLLRASLHSCFASSLSLLPRASCNLAESAHPSPSLLARATCNLAESAPPCEFTFMLRKFAKPAPSCFLQPRRICSPVRVYFSDSEVRLACSLVLLATLPSLLLRASLHSCFASSLSLLPRASCNLAESAHPCEFTSLIRKFA
ncbi:hypothetical protein CRG98_042279, partial [Punica granatum]